jgi:hypothetical protein
MLPPTPSTLRTALSICCAAAFGLGVGAAQAQATQGVAPFSSARGAQAPEPWRFATLPNKQPTRFEVVQQGAERVLKVEADGSYGNLVHATQQPLAASTTLSWRWRVEQFVQNADLRTRAGDDGAAKLCVIFDFPVDRLSLAERSELALARFTTGQDLPSETLCYVWDRKEPKGSTLANAFTRRIRMVVLESGPAAVPGNWTFERRNLLADYRRAFGDEAGSATPTIVAIAVSADADNTGGHGVSYFSDVDLSAAVRAASLQVTQSEAAERRP